MKVYYIGNRYDGCYYVRCLLPLRHNGWDGERVSMRAQKATPEQMVKGALNADVVVFQRPDDEARVKVVELLKKAGKKVVYDNDDTYLPDSGTPTKMYDLNGEFTLDKINKNLVSFMEQADLVTTTTEFLAEEYRQHSKNVVVLPNMIDPDDWDEPLRNGSDKVRIGFVGSVLSNNDYAAAIPALKQLSKMENVQIVIFGLPPNKEGYERVRQVYKEEIDFWTSFNIEWQPIVSCADYPTTLNELRLDLMLIPREESYFNKAKSNIKFLEAAMCEIPVIASSFSDKKSPYDKDLNGENGILVPHDADWMPYIMDLVENKEKRREIGRKAKEYTLQNYNIQTNYQKWEEAYLKTF